LIDVYGRELISGKIGQALKTNYLTINGANLQTGVYYFVVRQGETLSRNAVVKVK
jgi:hypothetical protein